MKDIGQNFREARETIGVSKEEVIKDLSITIAQLDNLEDGNANAFKDVFFLKELIKKYAKYLNLDEDSIIDEFNNFIFGYTSKIPVEDILEQTREIKILEKQKNENKIVSPYTMKKKKDAPKYILLYIGGVIILAIIVLLLVKFLNAQTQIELVNYIEERSI